MTDDTKKIDGGQILKDSFIFYRSFAEAIDDLPDREQLKVYQAIKEYALNEHEVELTGIANSFFKLIKPQIAANNRKYLNGTKGGRPPKKEKPNNNLKGTKEKPSKNQNISKGEPTSGQPKTIAKPNENGNGNVNENGNGNDEKPPPFFLGIKNKLKEKGFPLDDDSALESLIANTDPSWFDGHSFIDFVADVVLEEYSGKPKREQRRIFRKLLFDAANLRDEYPQWREQREKEDAARLKKDTREKALAAIPKNCPKCGAELSSRLCCSMHGWFDFQEETLEYVFIESGKGEQNFSIMFENFRSGKKAAR